MMDGKLQHERWMREALEEAKKGEGYTHPNPVVGAVLVQDGKEIARGYHQKAGEAHAEVAAIRAAGGVNLQNAVLYITLEPCSTVGRTGACTDLILQQGIKKVVIGAIDPNPEHQGKGVEILQKQGVEVEAGVLEEECQNLNRAFNWRMKTGNPWVISKAGMSLDGRLTRPRGESSWLTGERSLRDVHLLRSQVDAIVVGAGTVLSDDPALTIRHGISHETQPWRVILAGEREISPSMKLLSDAHQERTLVFRRKSLSDVLEELKKRGVQTVLLEGGGKVTGEAFRLGLVNEVRWYYAPRIVGNEQVTVVDTGFSESVVLEGVKWMELGGDFRLQGFVK